ncbi:MAG: DUF560 domain-containing protein [Magnetococcales bacterium]|nr:DUF560 domain-containing protein [Magnetococcales bacterium]
MEGSEVLPWQAAAAPLQAGDYVQSLAILSPLEEHHAGEPAFDVMLGSVLFRLRDYGAALFPLERVLMNAPGDQTARLMLAMTLHRLGEIARARTEAAALHFDRLPPALVDEWREMIRPKPPEGGAPLGNTRLQGHLQSAFGRDTNVTAGPGDGGYLIPSYSATVPVSLGSSEAADDWVTSTSGVVTASHRLGPLRSLVGGVSVSHSLNRYREDREETYGSSFGGLAFQSGRDTVTPVGFLQGYWLGGSHYQHYWGGQINWSRVLGEGESLHSHVQFLDTTYPGFHTSDSRRYAIGTTHLRRASGGIFSGHFQGLYGGLVTPDESGPAYIGYGFVGANLGGRVQAAPAVAVSGSLNYEYRHHPDPDNLYSLSRTDNQFQGVLSVDYALDKEWHLIPRVSLLHADSNLAVYAYDRATVSLALQWSFGQ